MVTVVAVFLISIIFIFIDLVPLYKEQQWRSFWIYAILLFSGCLLSILIDLGIEIPSPAEPLKNLISALWGLE